ncbi:MAG TPA: class I SAM-dependent methyltransferase [Streptosporangiaceae bacterium]|nr:class I SAM-dependent methyltransferase [Streptosporangiaceae bacterium]
MIDSSIADHYAVGYERSRLFPGGRPSLEFVRSMELLDRLLPEPPARVLDVGGGPGSYAAPLASRGYQVHLVDPVPLHVAQAREIARGDPATTLPGDTAGALRRGDTSAAFTASQGDARELAQEDESQDAVLLFGPLYHLTEAAGRQQALAEARRVLRPGGRLLAMAISRFSSLLDGCTRAGWTTRYSGR